MLHSVREPLISQRTTLLKALRGHFAELGIVVAQGARNVGELRLEHRADFYALLAAERSRPILQVDQSLRRELVSHKHVDDADP